VNRRTACLLALGAILQATPARPGVASDRLTLDGATRDRCLAILEERRGDDEFWPAMHAAEALTLDGRGRPVRDRWLPRLSAEPDAQRRCGLARELVRAGDLPRTATLLGVLASPDPYGHVHACESLFKVNQIGDGVSLRRALATAANPRLEIMSAAALARWGNPEALEALRRRAAGDDPATAPVAAWVLARVGDRSDIPALRDGARRFKEPLARAYFEHALAALGDPEGLDALVANLDQPDPSLRVYAAEFAPEARALGAKGALIRRLDDPVADVRIRAAQALLQLGKAPPPPRDEVVVRDVFPASSENPRYSEGSVVALDDGRLLYATTEFIGGGSDFAGARVVAVESADGGRTWSDRRVLQENVGRTNVMSVTLRRLRPDTPFAGPIGFFYLVKDSPQDLQAWLRVSHDEGKTFGEPARVTDRPGYHVLNNDRVTVLSGGRIVVPVASTADVFKENTFVCWAHLSDDGGATWRRSRNGVPYGGRGAMEPEVVEQAGGVLLMHIRTQLGHIAVSESADGGETWGEPRGWGVRAPEAPSTLRRIPSTGDLLLVWNDTFREGEGHGGRRTPLTAAVSRDGGKTWSHRRDVETDGTKTYAYTSVLFDRGRALLTYYVRDEADGRISSRFRSVPIGWFYGGASAP